MPIRPNLRREDGRPDAETESVVASSAVVEKFVVDRFRAL